MKNAREIPNDLENKGEVMTEMCLYWLAYMEHGHSGTFLLEFLNSPTHRVGYKKEILDQDFFPTGKFLRLSQPVG